MRRRAASNNPKRVPKALQELLPKTETKAKRKRKVNKRRIKARNRDPRRTILHLWFAKRFKLELKWNQLVPYKNNAKNQRILYRCSKRGYTVFYLSFLKSFLLEAVDKQGLLDLFSHFCCHSDWKTLQQTPNDHQCVLHFYKCDQYPLHLVGPCQIVPLTTGFWITSHISVYDEIITELSDKDSSIKINQNLNCSYIRLYGPKASSQIEKRLLLKKTWQECQVDFSLNKFYSLKSHQQITIADFIRSTQTNNNDSDTIAVKRHLQGCFEAIDIVTVNSSLKTVWNALNKNLGHLVGGLRDLQVMAINSNSLFFPQLGYTDPSGGLIIRDAELIETILSSDSWNPRFQNACVLVSVDFIKGVARENDSIYLPDQNVVEYLSDECFRLEKREFSCVEMIGSIQYGCYCMQASKCRAVGVMHVSGYKQLVNVNETITKQKQTLYALVKTLFNHVNIVTVSILKPNCLI